MSKDQTYRRLINCTKWRNLRNAYLAAYPQCQLCRAQGVHQAANCVHHIVPVETARNEADAERLAYSWSNLQALCLNCHKGIHQAERSHSRQVHQERQEQALERWKARHTARLGGVFSPEGGITPKSTAPASS